MLWTAAILLLVLAVALLWLSGRQRKNLGMPGGRVVYSDTQRGAPLEKPLYDAELKLTGRPDYLIEQGDHIIPVEVKSRQVGAAPYDSHIYQLAAYCYLVEQTYGKRPPYGILRYANRSFSIDYTPQLEESLKEMLREMRQMERKKALPRSHEEAPRCRRCGYRRICDEAL